MTQGRKAGGTNYRPKIGSVAESVYDLLWNGTYEGPTRTAMQLGCSVKSVSQAAALWGPRIQQRKEEENATANHSAHGGGDG